MSARMPRRSVAAPCVGEALQDRQHERRGLAGAGLGDADDVASAQHERDGFGLDGCRFGVAGFAHGFGDFRA